jgi:hypothetical protein
MAQLTEPSLPHSLAVAPAIDDAPTVVTAFSTPNGASRSSVDAIVSEIHEYEVPAFAADALDRLHGSLYASFRHLALCDAARPTPHTWIGYRRGEVIGVLLFRMRGLQAVVLTEMIDLGQEVVTEFCRAVFSRFAYAEVMCFNAVSIPRPLSGLVLQQYVFSENYVIELPERVHDYVDALGKSTRKTLRGYGNRLRRDHRDFRWEVSQGPGMRCDELRRLIRQLQAFKRASMALRGKRAELSRRDCARMMQLMLQSGLIGIARIDGRVCGGSLACRVGDNYVMLLSAADPALESYRLGMLCCFWSVCDCIRIGARECHLLWGRYQYKTQLLGQPRALYRLAIYRSPLQMALSPTSVLSMSWMSARYRLRDWLLARDIGMSRRLQLARQFVRTALDRLQPVRGKN